MKKTMFLLLSIVMFSTACKHTKNAEKTDTTPAPTIYRVIVSFGSPGSGIDAQTVAKLESYIITFDKEANKTIAYETIKYGKEGEVDYCFPLTELSKSKQTEFVNGINNLTKNGKIVFVKENAVCAHKKTVQ